MLSFSPPFRFWMLCFISFPFFVVGQSSRIDANGITIAYEAFGDPQDDAIILIQGSGASLLHYPAELCQKLSEKGFYVIRFDNRDIGLSTHLDSLGMPDWNAITPFIGTCEPAPLPYTLEDMAKDVTGLMDALHLKNSHLVGTSMGGAIGQIVAIHYPERVRSLTCISATSGNPGRPPGDEKVLTAMATPPPDSENTDQLTEYLVKSYRLLGATDSDDVLSTRARIHIEERNWNNESIQRQLAAVLVGDYCNRESKLKELQMPVMIIHGSADPIVPPETGKALHHVIPQSKLCIIDGMGHDLSSEFIDQINDCILQIISVK